MRIEDELSALRHELKYGGHHKKECPKKGSLKDMLLSVGLITATATLCGVASGCMTKDTVVTLTVVSAALAIAGR